MGFDKRVSNEIVEATREGEYTFEQAVQYVFCEVWRECVKLSEDDVVDTGDVDEEKLRELLLEVVEADMEDLQDPWKPALVKNGYKPIYEQDTPAKEMGPLHQMDR